MNCGCILLVRCFLAGAFFFVLSSSAPAQFTDWEDTQSAASRGGVRTKEEATLIAGPDQKWFTRDDAVSRYSTVSYDRHGRVKKEVSCKAGNDVQEYWIYNYNIRHQKDRECYYHNSGPDGLWFTRDDAEVAHMFFEYGAGGKKARTVRYDLRRNIICYALFEYSPGGKLVEDVEYQSAGADGRWFTSDDAVEKYHRLEYDQEGRLSRVTEYHGQEGGRGPDGIWFTPDDIVTAAKEFLYDEKGLVGQTNKYIAPGPDGKWFTGDDVLQYYTLRSYEAVP